MKTVAVIGARSMLGTRLISQLEGAGVAVVTVGRFPGADIHLDLNTGFDGPLPVGVTADVLFHCASSFGGDSPEGIRDNLRTNVLGCSWVLELSAHLGCQHIVYAGTVFSGEESNPERYTSYGFTKSLAEQVLGWEMKRIGGRFSSLRLPQLYDTEGLCVRHQPWFGRIIAYAARGVDLNMPGSSGTQNFLHVDDAVRFLVAAGDSATGGVLGVAHPRSLTYHEIATMAYAIFGHGGRASTAPNKTPFRPIVFPDGSAARRVLGVEPEVSLDAGIARIRDAETWAAFGPMDVT